ncbi:AP-1 complex subunit sigma-2 [Plecturocebus cupreus]
MDSGRGPEFRIARSDVLRAEPGTCEKPARRPRAACPPEPPGRGHESVLLRPQSSAGLPARPLALLRTASRVKFPTSPDPPAPASPSAGITGLSHRARPLRFTCFHWIEASTPESFSNQESFADRLSARRSEDFIRHIHDRDSGKIVRESFDCKNGMSHYQTEKKKITRELVQTVLARKPKMCSFVEWRDLKIVYKRYASLYFCCAIEDQDNELITLEIIHRYVELLDNSFREQ